MLSIRLPHSGLFLSFEIEEIQEEFKAALEEWFRAEDTSVPAEWSAGAGDIGPAIGGISAVTVVEYVCSFAGIVEEARSRTQARLISGTPESLAELCSVEVDPSQADRQ